MAYMLCQQSSGEVHGGIFVTHLDPLPPPINTHDLLQLISIIIIVCSVLKKVRSAWPISNRDGILPEYQLSNSYTRLFILPISWGMAGIVPQIIQVTKPDRGEREKGEGKRILYICFVKMKNLLHVFGDAMQESTWSSSLEIFGCLWDDERKLIMNSVNGAQVVEGIQFQLRHIV